MKLGVCVVVVAVGSFSCASGQAPSAAAPSQSTAVEIEPAAIPEPAEAAPETTSSGAPAENMLPADFKVYTLGNAVINHPQEGFGEKTLPTANVFMGSPGCYVACYSHDAEHGVYGVGGGIFVNGQVRVEGAYEGRLCLPTGHETADISAEQSLKDLCGKHVASCGHNCWAGGDTGGWFGIR